MQQNSPENIKIVEDMNFSSNPAGVPPLGFTHGGRFHADDVFSTALLKILRPDIRIYRGYEVPKGFSGIVYDIGNGEFDHHLKDSPRRPNGAPYAALGLLWRKYGQYFFSPRMAKSFDDKFIQPLDIDDNKGNGNVLAHLIGCYNPAWDADQDADAAFEQAVEVAQSLLWHRIASAQAVERGNAVVRAAAQTMQDNIVALEQYVPWKPELIPSEAEFVIFPSERSGYSLQCVPRDFSAKSPFKVPLPAEWHAAPAPQLQQLSGVADVTFCHASGFMCAVGSKQGALALAKKAQREYAIRKALQAQRNEERAAREAAGAPAPAENKPQNP